MPKTKIPSPARSQGATTPKRKKSRGSRSVCSPALSTASGRLTSLIDQFKEKNMESFALSPLNRRSILNDDTAIEEPRRQSWWKKLKEDSHEIMEVLEENKVADSGNNAIEELIDIEVLSQEKKEYTLDLPESSDNESINSIVLPQRKLFTQKENKPQKKFGQFSDNRETLAKLHKTNTQGDKTVNVGTRELFQNAKRSKPIFPAALLNISPNKTAMDKTKENILPEPKVRNIFGNRPANKRKNMFADFVVSESEDEIPELQPRVFGFQKKLEQRRISSISKGREGSPASSITTDMEMDDWKLLPSSTMVENQLEDIVAGHTPKRARLSKLSEAKESEAGTLQTNTTGDKTKSSNKSIMSKNKSKSSPDMKDKSLNSSRTTRSMLKNASKLEEKTEPKQDTKSQSKISTKDNELDVSSSKATTKQNTSLNKSLRLNKSRTRNSSKLNEDEMETDENVVKNTINDATRVISKNVSSATVASKSINEKERTITLKVHDKASETGSNKEEDENNFVLQYEDEIIEEATNHNESKSSKIKNRKTIVIENHQETDVNKSMSNKSVQKEPKQAKTVEESVESQNEQSGNDNIDGNEIEENAIEENHESNDGEKISRELNEESNKNDERNITEDNEDQENDEEMNESQENDEEINLSQESNRDEAVLSRVDEENESEINEENQSEDDVNESNESEEQNESQEVEAEVDESQEMEEQNESQEIENEANESQEVNEEADDSKVEENASEDEEENQEVGNDEEEENVEESQEVDNEDSQEIEHQEEHEVSQESEHDISQEVENDEENEEENDEEDQEVEQEVENQSEDDIEDQVENQSQEVENDQSQEVENDEENDEEENEESQEIENDEENQVEIEAEVNESQEIENDQEMDDSDEADRAIASDPEISDQDDNGADEMEVDDDDDNNEQESENEEETEGNQEESQEGQQEPSAEEIEESPNVTHDTTGRHRQKVLKSPEAILHDKTNQMDSFTAKGRNTSIRKTKSMIKNLNIRPSLAPRDSLAFSDGTRDSSAEGSGWDSHRTTRKTLRQTFGKDFTPRKSLRALVMEKSAKRQTEHMDLHSETSKYPQANSTELPEDSNGHVEDFVESDHEVSRRTRQTTLETYLQKIKQKNLENKVKMEELVRNSLKAPARDTLSLFKVPNKPAPRRLKPTQNKPRTQVKAITAFGELPTEVIEDMKYKPPKRFQPTNASWITKRLYKFLETKLEPKYDYKARVRAEKLVETIYHFAKDLRRHDVAPTDAVDVLKHELARLEVVQTHFEFYEFFHEFMPREVRVKVVPDIVNKIPLPRHGVFSDILRGNNVQG